MAIVVSQMNKVVERFSILSHEQEDLIIKLCREFEALEERRMNEEDE